MPIRKFPVYGARRKAVKVDSRATEGAVLGVNLFNPDGSLVTAQQFIKSVSIPRTADQLPGGVAHQYFTAAAAVAAIVAVLDDGTLGNVVFGWDGEKIYANAPLDDSIPKISISWGDAAGSVWTTTRNGILTYARLIITTPFNGDGTYINIGTDSVLDNVIPSAYIDPTVEQEFENTPDVQMSSGDSVVVTVVPGSGASAGSGTLILGFTPD